MNMVQGYNKEENMNEEERVLREELMAELDRLESEREASIRAELKHKFSAMKREEQAQSVKNVLSSITATAALFTIVAAIYSFYVKDNNRISLTSAVEKQISFQSEDIRNESEKAQTILKNLIEDLDAQKLALETLDKDNVNKENANVSKELAKLTTRYSSLEADVRRINNSRVIQKVEALEDSIEGDPVKVLSVPLIRNDLKNYKLVSEKEMLRLEKSIEKLESRLNFFVTTTITLAITIFTAIVAPLLISYMQRKKKLAESE
ncbi:hypothetical protein [Aliivibrio sp. EL58]|uniref:hypothetical protein n=1 Tax=Aliivibrio sp. EL58 TaxID=2107582 RepID=UPI000EFC7067|nr:hypothetical protein [Aliivibrio sp. EL58]